MKFHDTLNEKLWTKTQQKHIGGKISYILKPEVAEKLNEIADAFIEYMEIDPSAVKDVVITGSSASFNYTPHSDLDLHLKVDYDLIHEDCPIVEGFLWALKSTFNKDHDISIYGVPVEVYAEPLEENAVSNGIYSLKQHKWLKEPEPIEPTDNDAAVIAKYNELKEACERIKDSEVAQELLNKIYEMRKAGLSDVGEFSTENLAFKKLRDDGIIDKLKEMKKEKIDKELSLESYNEDKLIPCIISCIDIDGDQHLEYENIVRDNVKFKSQKDLELNWRPRRKIDLDKWFFLVYHKQGSDKIIDKDNNLEDYNISHVPFDVNYAQSEYNENSDRIKYSMLGSKKKRINKMNEDIRTEYAIINFLKKYGFATQEDLYNNIDAKAFMIDEAIKQLLLQDKIKFDDVTSSISGWRLTNTEDKKIEENVDSFCDKIDNVNDELKALIKSLTPVPARVAENLTTIVCEALEEDVNTLCDKMDTAKADLDTIIKALKPAKNEAVETIFNPTLIKQALNMEKEYTKDFDDVAPKVMFFIIENNEIVDTKLVDRQDVYTYQPADNEYYLDMIRDTGIWSTDYNLAPVQKMVDTWNSFKM